LNTFFKIFVIKIRFSSNQKIGEGESNFDDKYSNLPNNRVGPFNRVGSRFLRN
jgi:hypothetical protein